MKRILFTLLITFFFFSCTEEPQFNGVWLGMAHELDKEVYVPLNTFMVVKSDGTYKSHIIDLPDDDWSNWEIKNGTLHIDTFKYRASKYEIREETFKFDLAYKAYLKRLEPANSEIDTEKFKQTIESNAWESEYDQLSFNSNGDMILISKQIEKKEKLCWETVNNEGYAFLIKKGNHLNCDENYRFTELIIDFNSEEFTIGRWQDSSWQEIRYKKINQLSESIDSNNFQLCYPYLYRDNPKHRYYYKGTFYKGGIYKINKLLNQFYKAPKNSTESGLIKVEFIVNCQGKPGIYSMMQFDNDYNLKEFSPEISKQIFDFTKTLVDWKAGTNEAGVNIDTHRFLTYRIKDGEIIEIFP